MADSENSRILPLTTRRNVLSVGAAIVIAAATKEGNGTPHTFSENDTSLLTLWQEWDSAHRRRCELTVLQRQLERKLMEVADDPIVTLHVPGEEKPFCAMTVEEIEQAFPGTEAREAKNKAVEKLQSLQHKWDQTGWELGYTQACREEVIADKLEWELAEALWRSSANSLDGVVAKLHSMIEMQDPDALISENPVPILRSILADLMRLNT